MGKDRSGLFEPAVKEYASRLTHYCRLELVELPESKKGRSSLVAINDEGACILSRIKPSDWLVALDERGQSLTSRELAEKIGKWEAEARELVFCIGGADGLSEKVRSRAQLVLSLSAMTLPHRLARVVAVEQIYRAFTLLRGEPYHK